MVCQKSTEGDDLGGTMSGKKTRVLEQVLLDLSQLRGHAAEQKKSLQKLQDDMWMITKQCQCPVLEEWVATNGKEMRNIISVLLEKNKEMEQKFTQFKSTLNELSAHDDRKEELNKLEVDIMEVTKHQDSAIGKALCEQRDKYYRELLEEKEEIKSLKDYIKSYTESLEEFQAMNIELCSVIYYVQKLNVEDGGENPDFQNLLFDEVTKIEDANHNEEKKISDAKARYFMRLRAKKSQKFEETIFKKYFSDVPSVDKDPVHQVILNQRNRFRTQLHEAQEESRLLQRDVSIILEKLDKAETLYDKLVIQCKYVNSLP